MADRACRHGRIPGVAQALPWRIRPGRGAVRAAAARLPGVGEGLDQRDREIQDELVRRDAAVKRSWSPLRQQCADPNSAWMGARRFSYRNLFGEEVEGGVR